MLADCREGPPLARVADIRIAPADPPATPGFDIRQDARHP